MLTQRRYWGGVCFFISTLALIFILVSLGTSEWSVGVQDAQVGASYMNLSFKPFAFGPYKLCRGSSSVCSDDWSFTDSAPSSKDDRVNVVKAFLVMSATSAGIASLVFLSTLIAKNQEVVGSIFSFVASLFGLIAMAVWVDVHDYIKNTVLSNSIYGLEYGFSYGLIIVAWVAFFFVGIIGIVASGMPATEEKSQNPNATV